MQARWTALVALLVLAVPVAAQDSASFTVAQESPPARVSADGGTTAGIDLAVNLTGEGFGCTSEVEAPVNTTATVSLPSDAPPNASVETTMASLAFAIPEGQYETEPYNDVVNATVQADVGGGVRENYTATLTLTSTFPGGTYDSCIPMEFSPAESDPAEVQLQVVADDPPEPDEDDGDEPPADDSGNETGPGTNPPANDTPGNESEDDNGVPVPWTAAPLAAILAALAGRRRLR